MPEVGAALPYASGAMVAAARAAIKSSVTVAPVSGFHHACYERGGGYCTFNGLIVAAQVVHSEGAKRVGISAIPSIMRRFRDCAVLLYQAGADPHINDPLGGWLTTEQLRERDRIVFHRGREMKLPIAWNLAGGYQNPLRKVLDVHDNTMLECVGTFSAENGEVSKNA